MPVLVTGASGFLGGRITELLTSRGEDVTILARPHSDLRHLDTSQLRIVRGDLANHDALRTAVDGATHIIHSAACSTDWAPRRTYLQGNVEATQNLLRAAERSATLERFVHISTTDVYGYPTVPCSEEQPVRDAGLPYNQTKIAAEEAVWSAERQGLPVTVLRPATIYGPRGRDFTQEVGTLLRQRMMALIDGGRATGGFTYVDNVAEAALAASHSPHTVGRAYNIADGTGASWRDYLALFARELRVPPPWLKLRLGGAIRLAGAFEDLHRLLHLPGRPLLTRHAVLLLGRDQEFPTDRARTDFGFAPRIMLEEGVRRSVRWLKDPQAHRRS